MSHCKAHPDYTAKRRPKVTDCFSCWKLFFQQKQTTVDAYASAIGKQDQDLSNWLRGYIDDITYAPLVQEVQTEFSFVSEEELPTEAAVHVDLVKPPEVPTLETMPSVGERGIKI